ncbi:MAG: hypothetical protein PUI41_00980, partial [Lachnospiraceae bacterium]|nr:hypothetical protein [Lachnospiraceae bacterium]
QSCKIFAYRGAYAPLLSSYFGGSQGHSPTFEQAHVGSDLLTLVSLYNALFLKIMVKSFIHIEKSLIIIVEFYKHRLFFPLLINQIVAYLKFNSV